MESVPAATCAVCGLSDNLLRCARCHSSYYCSRQHQKQDWKQHKTTCTTDLQHQQDPQELQPPQSSSEEVIHGARNEVFTSGAELRTPTERALKSARRATPISGENIVRPRAAGFKDFPVSAGPPFSHKNRDLALDEMCRNVIRDMDAYGVCVVDHFLGEERGKKVLSEVLDMYTKGIFKDGQLVSSNGRQDLKTIRGDQITWIDGREQYCSHVGQLISQVDALIMRANKMQDNGKLGNYNINGRTKVRILNFYFYHQLMVVDLILIIRANLNHSKML